MPLDLEEGDEELANATPAERRRAARKAAGESSPSSKPTSRRKPTAVARERLEAELTSRLDRTLDRIANTLAARGDDELSQAIQDDKEAMSQGIVSLTSNVKFLRGPLFVLLNLVDPLLAFGKVGRILYGRFADRQARIAQERQQQQEEASSQVAHIR